MTIFMRAIAATALTGALLASAGLAASQTPPPAAAPGQSQVADLPTLLHLRPDQLTAFHAIETAEREPPALIAQLRAKQQRLPSETTPQRLDFQAQMLEVNVAHQHRVSAALRKFYAALTPDQQHQFDQLTAPHLQQAPAQH